MLVALLPPGLLAAFAVGAPVVVVTLARPWVGLPLLLLAVPFGSLAQVEAGGFSIAATEPLAALVAMAWLGKGVREYRVMLPASGLVASVGAAVLLLLFSITYARDIRPAVKETLKWLELLLALVAVPDLANERRRATVLLATLFVAGSAEALWGIGQVVLGVGPSAFAAGGAGRAYGHFEQPNPFAGYLATILALALALAFAPGPGTRLRWLARGAAPVLGAGILFSQSRGAWLGAAAACATVLALASRHSRRLLFPLGFGGILGLALTAAGFLPGSAVARLTQTIEYFGVFDVRTVEVTPENFALVERMAHWQAAWLMFLDQPWLGVGAGNYAVAYPDYYVGTWQDPLGHAHNYYLNTLAELGVVGAALLLLTLGLASRQLVAALRAGAGWEVDGFWRALAIGLLASLVAFSVHSLFDNLSVHGMNVQLGVFLGLGVVAARRLRPARDPRGVVGCADGRRAAA